MNKFFYNLILVILSSLGIGFLSRFREIIAIISASFLPMILQDENRPVILIIITSVLLLFFAIAYRDLSVQKETHDKLVFRSTAGVMLGMSSPFIYYSIEWIVVFIIIYFIVRKLIIDKFGTDIPMTGYMKFVRTELITGATCMLLIQGIYSGFNLIFLISGINN